MANPTGNFTTYSQFKDASASEKTALCILEAAKRLVGWTVYSGSIYQIAFSESNVITSVEDDAVALTSVSEVASVTAGKYYFDKDNDLLYVRLSDSSHPDDSFIGVVFRYFFSNNGVKAPHDLSTGFDVYWMPLLTTLSDFRLEVDNRDTQLGLAIEGGGTIRFINDQAFWSPRYDKVFFDNQRVFIYSWERTLPITQAQILFRGRIQQKTYSIETVSFQAKDVLNELRDVFDLDAVGEFTYTHGYLNTGQPEPARVSDNQAEAKQRLIYGKAYGVVAMNIDQVLPDTPARRTSFLTGYRRQNDGTFDVTNGSKNVQANGTFRTADIMPGDQLLFSNDLTKLYTVEYYTTLFDMVLSENFEGATSTTVTARIFPQRQRRLHNRHFLVAGHPLSSANTVVQQVIDGSHFYVNDASEFLVGDNIVVTVEGDDYDRIIEAITDTNLITTTVLISPTPNVGDAVIRPGVQKVYLDSQLLIQGQDYTVDNTNALISLTSTNPDSVTGIGSPEFNHTKVQTFSGRVTFTNGTFGVTKSATPHTTGETTAFTTQFRPGDYIQQPNGLWREVWYVIDDDTLVLAGLATQTADSENGLMKYVDYYQEGQNKIICDVRGTTSDGTVSGTWLRRAPEIVENILTTNGLTDIDETSFDESNEQVPFDVGLVLPAGVGDKKSPTIRDALSQLSRSVFGTLLQNSDLDLAYSVIAADKVDLETFDRSDIVDFAINSDSSKLIKDAVVVYDKRELDFETLSTSDKIVTKTSEIGQYLLKLAREFRVNTNLVDSTAATIMAGRWAFLLELATSKLNTQMKLQGSQLSVGDAVQVNHPKLYERFGSDIKRRLGAVSLITRGATKSTMTIDDLSNAFSRVATIAVATAPDYVDANDAEKVVSGYITASNGLLDSDPSTHGLNVIWSFVLLVCNPLLLSVL